MPWVRLQVHQLEILERESYADWDNHKKLGRCPRFLKDPSAELGWAPTIQWEKLNLGRSRNRKLAVRAAQSTVSDGPSHNIVLSEARSPVPLTWLTAGTSEVQNTCPLKSLIPRTAESKGLEADAHDNDSSRTSDYCFPALQPQGLVAQVATEEDSRS